jgi:DNA-binding transcriptional ArsR family regulator
MSLLPLRSESAPDPDEPRVVGLDGDDADEAFDALSSSTTRRVLSLLYEDPSTPAEIRDRIGTSLQNVHYHVEKLEDAGLIEPAGVGYSEKGTEMTVYAPSNEAVVLFAGRRDDRSRLRTALERLFPTVIALLGATAVFAFSLGRFGGGPQVVPRSGDAGGDAASGDGGAGGEAAAADATATETATETASDGGGVGIQKVTTTAESTETATRETATPTEAVDGGAQLAADAVGVTGFDPVVAFLLGGLFALLALGVVWYLTE